MSDYLQPHRLQHARLPYPLPSPRVCSNSCPLSQWSSLTISASAALFFCLQSFPALGSFPMSRLFTSSGPSTGVSASVLLINIQGWFPSFRVDWFDLLAVRGTLKSLLQHHNSKASVLWHSAFFMVQLSHPYMITGKTITLPIRTSVGRVMSLLFNTLSRFVKVFLPRSKHLLISWLQSVHSDFGPQENKVCPCFHFSPSICHEVMGEENCQKVNQEIKS